jgi:flagellar protein FlaG
MNEIPNAPVAPTPIRPVAVSTPGSGVKPQKGGNDLPPAVPAAKNAHVNVKEMQEHVEAAVKQMNEYIQSTQRDLSFSYDKLSGETVVKVLDRGTQQVIRQIPDETFLKLARSTDSEGSFQLLNAQA